MNKRLTSIPLNLADFKKYTQTFRTKLEQIEYLAENKLVVQNKLKQNKNIGGNNNALMHEMVDYAENEINKLGGKPEKWIEYPLVTNVHDFNVRKESMKDEGRLLEWVKWLLNNVEPPVEENEGIKKDLGWSYNDRVLRQAKLDCIEQGKEYVELKWEALNLDDDFVDHLERQLKTNTDLLTPKPKRNFSRSSPISIFIDEQISGGRNDWQKAWSELRDEIADDKNTKTEDMQLHNFGEKEAFVRRTMMYTSNNLDYAIEYQEDGIPTFKTVSRQSFGRMFRKILKKSRAPSDSPK
jgi:hypothetical protein